MRPIVRYLSAAALILGALAWFTLRLSSSVALAEVIKATGQHRLVRYHLREIFDYKAHGAVESKRIVYADLNAPRLRFEQRGRTLNNVLEYNSVMVQDNQKDRFLKLISHVQVVEENQADAKQILVIREVKERGLAKKQAYLYRLTRKDGTPFNLDHLVKGQPLLDSLRELQNHKDTVSTRAELNGRGVLKYRLQEADKTTSLWVDPRTKLPLRIECEMLHPAREITKEMWIYTDFEWDPKDADPAQLFSTEPPPGYAVEDHTKDPVAPSPNPAGQTGGPRTVEDHTKDPVAPSPITQEKTLDSPESEAVQKRLEEKIAFQFPNQTSLEEVLKYLEAATRRPNDAGIRYAFDEDGLKRAGQTRTSLVTIDIQDEPVKTSLKKVLKPLGLTFEVNKGVLTITSEPSKVQKKP
ncbi:MAG: hypothetical protein ACLP53_12305 [Isosphaeraceae bacterium]